MPRIAIIFGVLLVAVGCTGYFAPDTFGENDPAKSSKTALIPAYLGGALVVCGLIVIVAPKLRKHVMHLAALIGLIGAVGGFVPIIRSGGIDTAKASVVSGILTTGLCVVFVIMCVMSFMRARIARKLIGPG